MARKRGYRGTIGRVLVHGGTLDAAMDEAANDWLIGVNRASAEMNYKQKLREYLKFYIPQIEQEYLNRINSNPDYFKDVNRFNREQTALAIMEKTHELAAQWKQKRANDDIQAKLRALGGNVGGFAAQYGHYSSKESPKVVASLRM